MKGGGAAPSSFISEGYILFFFILVFGLTSAFSGPEVGYDIANYHFYNGYAFIQSLKMGHFFQDEAPAGSWSFFNPLMDGGLYLLLTHTSVWWATFWIGAVEGLLGFFTYLFAKALIQKTGVTWLAVIVALSSPAVLHQVGSTHGDLPASIFFMVAFWRGVLIFQQSSFTLWKGLGLGLLIGVGVGLKLTLAPFGLSFLIAGIFFLREGKGICRLWLGVLLGSFLGFLLSNGGWMFLLYQHYGNPFFPFWNQIFHSPYFSYFPPDPTFRVTSLKVLLELPFTLMTENNHVNEAPILDFRLGLFFIFGLIFFGALSLKTSFRRQVSSLDSVIFFSVFVVVSYGVWAYLFGIYRYAVPMHLVDGVLLVYFGDRLLDWIKDKGARKSFLGISVFVIVIFTLPTVENASPVPDPFHRPYLFLKKAPVLPPHSLVIMTTSNRLLDSGSSFVLPLLKPEQSVQPNFYPERTLYFSEGKVWLSLSNPRNLSVKKILNHHGPMFLLLSVERGGLPKGGYQRGAIALVPIKKECSLFETSIAWVGKLALCEVRMEGK